MNIWTELLDGGFAGEQDGNKAEQKGTGVMGCRFLFYGMGRENI